MGIRKYKPTTPGRRGSSVADFVEVTRSEPEKSLVRPLAKKGGRNNSGKITTRHQGGGHGPRDRFGSVPEDLVRLQGQHVSPGASHDRHAETFCIVDDARLSEDLDDDLRAPCLGRASEQ